MEETKIETLNQWMVGSQGKNVRIMNPPLGALSANEAMRLAAWLVTMAEMDATHKFEDVLKAVQNS